ncbi:YcgL domain-containing protein [Citrobacter sp. Awk 4]|uniref:YcgL domain-containing protein n=1 Tax=Citrobacter sp. Awk 4 TaxID=2963955 RepID=UPI002302E0BC|nr:YcgL domain-containing protein [Citrobacter sp. Awk 4]MDA8479683.1 YcgL domain-containing protein [Citrobacter sp. Awk 4]
MFCVIYRSTKRDQTYLYVEKKDDFSRVSEELLKGFGQPQLAMILPLDGRKKLANADIDKVKQALAEQGYYLQLPPPPEDLLKQHLSVAGENKSDAKR